MDLKNPNQNINIQNKGLTKQLAQYVVDVDYDRLSEEVIHAAKRCLLDWLGVALGGSSHRGIDSLIHVYKRISTQDKATIIGRNKKADILHAAFINGCISHVLDYDDTNLKGIVHPSAPVWPAIASLSAMVNISGKQALLAFILGYEVENRIGRVLFRHHDQRGWHMSGMVGGFGAAAATGKLLKLDVAQLSQSFGTAASCSSGLREMLGTMTKWLHVGKAAMSGLHSSLLAQAGFISSERVLEAPRGFFAVNAGENDIGEVVEGLGKGFEIFKNSIKPYPCGVVIHPAVDGIIKLRNREGIRPKDIATIEAEVNKMVPDVTGIKSPTTGLEGKFSVFHCIAAALVDGACGLDQFTDDKVNDPYIVSVRERVSIKVNKDFPEYEARIRITLTNGRIVEEHVPFARGTHHNPFSDEELTEKYYSMAEKVLGSGKARELEEKTWTVDQLDDFQKLISLTAISI